MENPATFKMNSTDTLPLHPYFPIGLALPTYAANSLPASTLVPIFAAGCAFIFLTTYITIQQTRPGLSNGAIATALWFVLCGFIHLFFEGYFAYNAFDMVSKMDIFGQLWKEYSLSDSRYMTQDSFVVCMETITAAFWGPLSFVCAYCIVTDHPLRHPLQLITSLGQLYGDVLYYATCTFSSVVFEVVYCRPERMYFWAYYVLCNAFWIVIPFMLLMGSVEEITRVFAQAKEAQKEKKSR